MVFIFTINFIPSKLYEVAIKGDFIILRNLYKKKKIESKQFVGVKNVFFSPIVYYVELTDSKGFYFASDLKTLLKNSIENSKGWEEIFMKNFVTPSNVEME